MVNFKLAAVLLLTNSVLTLAARRQYKLEFFDDSDCRQSVGSAAVLWRGECGEFDSIKPTAFLLEDNPKGLRCKSGYQPKLLTWPEAGCPGPANATDSIMNSSQCNWLAGSVPPAHYPTGFEIPVVKSAKWQCLKSQD
ncbi:hypothetical protein FE257_005840 [Aspergillus nanangensis]|uniref:Secreted protein n=1 Tax=Aspergillus nanangensis TaxID=2582783 RepID=A0AAD4CPP7_ASPNN|nr:hypothetical protein FE257_005840 [Aspergillus nanangensis]